MFNLNKLGLTRWEVGFLVCAGRGEYDYLQLPASPEPERFVLPWQEVPKTRALRAGLETS